MDWLIEFNFIQGRINDENIYSFPDWYSCIFNLWVKARDNEAYMGLTLVDRNQSVIYHTRPMSGEPNIAKIALLLMAAPKRSVRLKYKLYERKDHVHIRS